MKRVILVFIIVSFVSLFADIAYEGGRSISGQFLEYLGAPAVAAGVIALGEFLGYAIRLPVGIVVAKMRSSRFLWLTVILGYALVLAIPALALVGKWDLALLLYMIERLGKGLRSPARDVVIADITDKAIGRGKAFGLHELLDQVGAITGPLIVSYAIMATNSYSYAYSLLLPAAITSLILVIVASLLYPQVNSISNNQTSKTTSLKMFKNSKLKSYMIFTALLSFGIIHWSLVSYHLAVTKYVEASTVPLLYALAMIVDAIVALPLGVAYDKHRLATIMLIPIISAPIAPLILLSNNIVLLGIASALYGVVLCSYESILRAAVADLALPHERAIGFGWLGFVWGIFWAFGNLMGGLIYDLVGPKVLTIVYPVISVAALIYSWRELLH